MNSAKAESAASHGGSCRFCFCAMRLCHWADAVYMSLSKLEIPHRQPRQDELRHQNGGQPPTEIPVLRLVSKGVHTQNSAHRAPQQGQQKQRLFRHPPLVASCPPLVGAVHQKGGDVDERQIRQRTFSSDGHLTGGTAPPRSRRPGRRCCTPAGCCSPRSRRR